jgi:hypothetical protein
MPDVSEIVREEKVPAEDRDIIAERELHVVNSLPVAPRQAFKENHNVPSPGTAIKTS